MHMANESMLTRIPENTSFLQTTKFSFSFPTLPFLKYFCQSVTLPGISTQPVAVTSPFAKMYRHGDTLEYEPMVVTALIDEDLRLWEETYNWLLSLTKPKQFSQYVKYYNAQGAPYHDGALTVNTNANNPNLRIKFTNCHPVSLSQVQFSTFTNAETTITCDISFRYDQFEFERLA
jgi:hypothetical protein